jgi:hypothetical protein
MIFERPKTGSTSPPSAAAEPKDTVVPLPATASAATGRQPVQIEYVDRPEMLETFADAISGVYFDGQTLRIEFAITRLDEIKPNTPITGRRYPACRIILPPTAAIDLINRMQQIGAALTQAGVAKPTPRETEAT